LVVRSDEGGRQKGSITFIDPSTIQIEVGERVWEVSEGLLEVMPTKSQACERGWEMVHGMVEEVAEREIGERGRKVVDWLVEVVVEVELVERGREVVDWLVEFIA